MDGWPIGLLGGHPGVDGGLGDPLVIHPGEPVVAQDEGHLGLGLIAAIPAGMVIGPGVDHGHDLFEAVGVFVHEFKILQIRGQRGLWWTAGQLALGHGLDGCSDQEGGGQKIGPVGGRDSCARPLRARGIMCKVVYSYASYAPILQHAQTKNPHLGRP